MKNKKIVSRLFATLFMVVVCLTTSSTFAQMKTNHSKMKDCCMMKDGKMMCMKAGKTMPMEKDMTMKNGTKCMTNGECIMKDGTKMQMKDGECIDMSGKMNQCSMMNKGMKGSSMKKTGKKEMSMNYTCPMHPDEISDKPGKCSKCGMALVQKK